MNHRILSFSFLILILLPLPTHAEASKIFTLKDGATFQGNLSSVENGIYTVESPTLGKVQLKGTDIISINSSVQSATASPLSDQAPKISSADQMKAVKEKITSSPEIMADIQAIASNSDLLPLLTNPALLTAAAQGPQALQGNPTVEKLLKNPEIQALIQKIQATQTQP